MSAQLIPFPRSLEIVVARLAIDKAEFASLHARRGALSKAEDQRWTELENAIERGEAECDARFQRLTGVEWATYVQVRS